MTLNGVTITDARYLCGIAELREWVDVVTAAKLAYDS